MRNEEENRRGRAFRYAAAGLALLGGAVLLSACGGGVGDAVREDYARKCAAKGLTPDSPDWGECLAAERSRPDNSLKNDNEIRWGI